VCVKWLTPLFRTKDLLQALVDVFERHEVLDVFGDICVLKHTQSFTHIARCLFEAFFALLCDECARKDDLPVFHVVEVIEDEIFKDSICVGCSGLDQESCDAE